MTNIFTIFTRQIKHYSLFVLMVAASIPPALIAGETSPSLNHPYPQHTRYIAPNLKPSNYTQQDLDSHVAAYYEQWKKEFLVPLPDTEKTRYRIAFGRPGSEKHAITVSEGQGYGMIITVLMAGYDAEAQEIYNGLLRFVQEHPSREHNGLMAWRVNGSDKKVEGSAFDGDADIAYSLLLADKQWGSAGKVNYRLAAEIMIERLYDAVIGPYSKLPMFGDWVDYEGEPSNQFTIRSSDLMLSNFYAFSGLDTRWKAVLEKSTRAIKQLQDDYAPTTMLLPDFFVSDKTRHYRPAPANFLEGENDGNYYYNACRTPLRIGIYTLLHGNKDLSQRLQKLSLWIEKKSKSDVKNIHAGYRLSGDELPKSSYATSLFKSSFAAAALQSPAQQTWLNVLYESIHQQHIDYYEDTVTLLTLLLISGNYWD